MKKYERVSFSSVDHLVRLLKQAQPVRWVIVSSGLAVFEYEG